MKDRAIYLIIFSLLALTISQASNAWPPDRRDTDVKPSISTIGDANEEEMSWGYLCYSFRTGALRSCTIRNHTLKSVTEAVALGIKSAECQYDIDGSIVPSTCANGGHEHSTTTSIVRPQSRIFDPVPDPNFLPSVTNTTNELQPLNLQAPLAYDSPDMDPGTKFNVAGPWAATGWILVKYPTPDNAGSFYWQAQIEPPPCYFLAFLCGFVGRGAQDDGTLIWDGTVNVGFDGLRQLPEMTDLYRKIRGAPTGSTEDPRHRDNVSFAGTARAITAMQLIAFQYTTKTKKLLRPNDMSLPFGGLFGVFGRYRPAGGHYTHREGEDIDLNRGVLVLSTNMIETTECENDIELFEAVNKVLIPVPGRIPRAGDPGEFSGPGGNLPEEETALLCELNPPPSPAPDPPDPDVFGRKHIDITRINFPPFIP